MNKLIKNNAFTLIELLVVIGIIVVLTAASVAGISASRNRKQVKSTAEKLKSFLTEARSLAVNPQDTSFGVKKIVVAVSNPNSGDNTIKLYKYVDNADIPVIDTPSFKIPNGIIIRPSTAVTEPDNMTSGGSINVCGSSCKYFSFSADSPNIGKIIDTNPGTANDVNIDITDGSQTYKLKMNVLTGMITITE